MRISRLWIARYKSLNDFEVNFDSDSPYTVFVGGNGSGKSNLIEAIGWIFRHLDLPSPPPFDYSITYECRGTEVLVEASNGRWTVRARRAGSAEGHERLSRERFAAEDDDGRPLYRPAVVFGYYSGHGDRLAEVFQTHRDRYYNHIIRERPVSKTAESQPKDPNSLRRLFYAETLHGQFALSAFFTDSGARGREDRAFLREHLQIDGLDSVLFALKKPSWSNPARMRTGDPRFWGSVGLVRDFLDKLYVEAMLPGRIPRRMATGLVGVRTIENLYLFLPDVSSLQRAYHQYEEDQYRFFAAMESTYLSEVLGEVRTRVEVAEGAGGGRLTYRDLSEGEQQLILVLGLLRFTAQDEALFLLDEPDTHLNPAWSTQYLDFIDKFTEGRTQNCHILMATHDPLVFSRLDRKQVRIVSRGETGRSRAETPVESPIGMGIEAILASDLFRLPSGGLDEVTMRDLERQRELAWSDTQLTADEESELDELNERLEQRGFWQNRRDPLYRLFHQEFVPRWLARAHTSGATPVTLTPGQQRRRAEVVAEIVAELRAEQSEPQEQ